MKQKRTKAWRLEPILAQLRQQLARLQGGLFGALNVQGGDFEASANLHKVYDALVQEDHHVRGQAVDAGAPKAINAVHGLAHCGHDAHLCPTKDGTQFAGNATSAA